MDILKIPQVQKFFEVVLDPALQILFAAAILYFIYGVFTFIRKSDDSAERITGANHILWSTVGLFIMISVWGIIAVIKKTINV
ncbi:MAG TPA: hypothetical protein VIR98_01825 [Candidatus Paceibacterota bacterium]|jgi:hypothetical protein